MALLKARSISVGTSPTRLDYVDDLTGEKGEPIAGVNNSAVIIYIGGPDVTTAQGCPVAPGQWFPGIDLPGGVTMHGCVVTGTADARMLSITS